MGSGDTKTEQMLYALGNGGSGDQFRGCCNTKEQAYILDAIDRINSLDPSTTNYETFTFTLVDGTTVEKEIAVKAGE